MGSNINALCSHLSLINQKGKRAIMKDQQRMNNAVHLIAVSDINYPKDDRLWETGVLQRTVLMLCFHT